MFSFHLGIVSILEYIGVVSFALYGAYTAMQKRMDLFGVTILAFTGACGGGILRDVVMDAGVPVFFSSYGTVLLVLLSVAVVVLFPQLFRAQFVLMALDALGLSFFAVDAGLKAIRLNYNFLQFVFVSVITAVGGGILRDMFAQKVPVIFKSDIYALAAVAGVTYMWFVLPYVKEGFAVNTAILLIFAVRMVSAHYHVNLPVIKRH
jgi:uncharacterized membrane protein YeiH